MNEHLDCGDNRFEVIEAAKRALIRSTNIITSPKEMDVLDAFLFRCWQMGWLKRYDTEANQRDLEDLSRFVNELRCDVSYLTEDVHKMRIRQTIFFPDRVVNSFVDRPNVEQRELEIPVWCFVCFGVVAASILILVLSLLFPL